VSTIPPIDSALLPADVRNGSPERKRAYEAGLGFERLLLTQLAKQLSDTTGGSETGSAVTQTYRDLLPDALASGVMACGGLGLARDLVDQLEDTGASK
jgi:Rod binding domain-containing protein